MGVRSRGGLRVVRGAAWFFSGVTWHECAGGIRVALRDAYTSTNCHDRHIGFRLCFRSTR